MQAGLFAIGPYSKDIVNLLSYPPAFYEDVEQGSNIFTVICSMDTTSGSKELATALGIEPWRFDQHVLPPDMIDVGKFAEVMSECKEGGFDLDEIVDVINALKGKGFLFIYHPNG
jgi:hypothetical protein